jgi:hypothetical protein
VIFRPSRKYVRDSSAFGMDALSFETALCPFRLVQKVRRLVFSSVSNDGLRYEVLEEAARAITRDIGAGKI